MYGELILDMVLNSSIVLATMLNQNLPLLSRVWRLYCGHICAFKCVDEVVSGGKLPAEKGMDIVC